MRGRDLWAVPDLSLPCLRMPDRRVTRRRGHLPFWDGVRRREWQRLYPVSPAAVVRFSASRNGLVRLLRAGRLRDLRKRERACPEWVQPYLSRNLFLATTAGELRSKLQLGGVHAHSCFIGRVGPLLVETLSLRKFGNARGPRAIARTETPRCRSRVTLESVGYYRLRARARAAVLLEDIAGFWVCQQGRYIDRWRITDRRNIEAHRRRLPGR